MFPLAEMKSLMNILKKIAYKLGLIADYITESLVLNGWSCQRYASGDTIAYLDIAVDGIVVDISFNAYNYVSNYVYFNFPEKLESQDSIKYLGFTLTDSSSDVMDIRSIRYHDTTQLKFRVYNPIKQTNANIRANLCMRYRHKENSGG